MFSPIKYLCSCAILFLYSSQPCASELVLTQSLVLYSPGEPEYIDVLVKRVNDNLTLVCEMRGDIALRHYVWNYVPNNQSLPTHERPFEVTPNRETFTSTLHRSGLQVTDSGHYMCSVPPFSVTKYIAVQTRGPIQCARGAFTCGARCVLPTYVCDGRRDCVRGEDESTHMCLPRVCARPDKLNCSSGRCISSGACCRGAAPLCRQPACCEEYMRELPHDGGGLIESEFPPLFEDHRAPDDYGFIQSTIYTVTACALIFMIAVVLLVSAICKMQMKRAALRGYTQADRAARDHYSVRYHQAHSFPPCYEASRLLDQEGAALSPSRAPHHLPTDLDLQHSTAPEPAIVAPPRGLARLTSIFSSRYRQVPTLPDVELAPVPPAASPAPPALPLEFRSPTYCDLDSELMEEMGRELNYMATPMEFFRRRTMRRNTLERVMDQLDRQRLTLQLGRFQLSIPRLGRAEPRPDTPVAAPRASVAGVEVLRLDARDTYTLNGRTIRLLGADIQHYPAPAPAPAPPSYTEAVRYKLYGPPPEYLSREGLNRQSTDVDQEAASNVEMPPRYDDLAAGDVNGNGEVTCAGGDCASGAIGDNGASCVGGVNSASGASENSDAVVETSGTDNRNNKTSDVVNGNKDSVNGNGNSVLNAATESDSVNGNLTNSGPVSNIETSHSNVDSSNSNMETLSSIIDNLPAIDSDVNANDGERSVHNDHVIRDNAVVAN